LFRTYRVADFRDFAEFHKDASRLDPLLPFISEKILAESLHRPKFIPDKDLFLAEIDGKIVGSMSVYPELEIGRVLLEILVHPQQRGKRIALSLLPLAMARAREMEAKRVQVSSQERNLAANRLLSREGFTVVRRFFELRLDLERGTPFPCTTAGAMMFRNLIPGEEGMLASLQNRCFGGTWGFNPNTREDILHRVSLSNSSYEQIILGLQSKKPSGYCWITINSEENAARKKETGRLHMLGVVPECRRQGIGKALVETALHWLKQKKIRLVELTVDSENHAALALYRSIGFRVLYPLLWYEKAVT